MSPKVKAKSPSEPRMRAAASLADELRARSDDEIARLFSVRSDLAAPVPNDFSSLAARATSTPSLVRSLDTLNLFQYQILEAICALEEPLTIKRLEECTDVAASDQLDPLWMRGLIYFDRGEIRVPRSLRELIGATPAGLGPVSLGKPKIATIAKAPPGALQILQALTWGSPKGAIGDRRKTGKQIEWLLEQGLLTQVDSEHVALPREVGLHLRGGKVHRELFIAPPMLEGERVKADAIKDASLASISSILRWIAELLDFWSEETPRALKTGGLGVRDLKKTAEHLGVDEDLAAFIAELAFLAGLISIEGDDRILPSAQFDIWQSQTPESRWREIASLWLATSRVSGLVRRADSKGITPLGSELDRIWAARMRRAILSVFESNPEISLDHSMVQSWIDWLAPTRKSAPLHREFTAWTIEEAEWLGITGRGALSPFGARFLKEMDSLQIDASLPPPIDHILVQADNTAIAPGPLTIDLSRRLSNFADIESRGNATVYRFTESSIRRGLDHGHTGDEIKAFLHEVSRTPIPQPLEYLIADIARRHGQLRVGIAQSFIRCEDETTILAITKDKRLENLRLRKIAPQVLVSEVESSDLIEDLRNAGYLPSLENQSGVVITAPRQLRSKSRARIPRAIAENPSPSDAIISAAIKAMRAGDRVSGSKTTLAEIPRTSANETLAILRQVVADQSSVMIGYADTNGSVTQKIIDPVQIAMGNLLARDHSSEELATFKIARITGVAPLE
jgi:hypothetical protein